MLLVPSEVLTLRFPDLVLTGIRNWIRLLDQVVKEGIAAKPILTELLPREEPKLLPVTVTRVLALPLWGETVLIQGEVIVTRNVSLPLAVTTCRLPVRAPVGIRT